MALEQLGADVLRGLDTGPERLELVRAMCEVLFRREVTAGPDGEVVVRTPAQGLGDDLRRILLQAGQALHFTEIARQLALPPYLRTELSDEKVRLRLCRDRRFVLVRRGLYDLTERFRIEPSLRAALTTRALKVLQEMKRPSSVALLGAELRREARFSGVNEFVLAAVLREDPRFTHLGRGTFVPEGSGRTSVVHVSEILREILRQSGGPLTYAELRRRVQAQRHVSDGAISATLVGRKLFLRVARGVFDLADRHPFDDRARKRIAEEAGRLLDASGGVLSLQQLNERLTSVRSPAGDRPGAILVGDLLRRQGGYLFLGGGYICRADGRLETALIRNALRTLAEAGEPLRPTTIARRLELGAGATALLRRVLRDDPRFRAHPEGRFSRA
jgi:hypothetical protein